VHAGLPDRDLLPAHGPAHLHLRGGVFCNAPACRRKTGRSKTCRPRPIAITQPGRPKYLSGERCSKARSVAARTFRSRVVIASAKFGNVARTTTFRRRAELRAVRNGLKAVLDGQPCDTEWQLCVSRDFNPPARHQGLRLHDGRRAQLLWTCGATNVGGERVAMSKSWQLQLAVGSCGLDRLSPLDFGAVGVWRRGPFSRANTQPAASRLWSGRSDREVQVDATDSVLDISTVTAALLTRRRSGTSSQDENRIRCFAVGRACSKT